MMDIYDVEIYRSKVGVKYFELLDTVKGLTLPQKQSLIGILKRMGVEYKVITHTGIIGDVYDIFGGIPTGKDDGDDIDDDGFFSDFIKGIN